MTGYGVVYLVGAGPGDPGLITEKGMRCIKEADVILYDHLIDESLLNFAPVAAEKVYVGKEAGRHALPQDKINRLLVEKAKHAGRVVRLKGGDPFVLGRGGEEALALVAAGIPFEIVPGVTSAVAVPAYAGIPLTHRGIASSFAVVTGHEMAGKKETAIQWGKLAHSVDTLVILMGTHNLREITAQLMQGGKPPGTPVAVISNGTGPEQKTVTSRLDKISDKVAESGLEPPAIVVVGKVVTLRRKIAWFERLPLHGKTVLVTRPESQAGALVRLLIAKEAHPVLMPAVKISALREPIQLDEKIRGIKNYRWVIFTSANTVEAFLSRLLCTGQDVRALSGIKVAAIGRVTASSLVSRGVQPDLVPSKQNSEGLLDAMSSAGISGMRILLPQSNIADRKLADGLSKLGALVDKVIAYSVEPRTEQSGAVRRLLESGKIDVVILTSASAVSSLKNPGETSLSLYGARVACIGPKTAQAVVKAGLKVDIIAREPSDEGLVKAIEEYFMKGGHHG